MRACWRSRFTYWPRSKGRSGALKKYLDMNRLALAVVAPGGLYLTCSCTGLVSEEAFLDMLRRQELLPLGLHTAEEFG
ncbi:MAG: hypothetical protein N3F11_02955, partial [Casimicrobiaceae bacterium]|nr:hypothetical protein [Casimicrobiaceae bacterium]